MSDELADLRQQRRTPGGGQIRDRAPGRDRRNEIAGADHVIVVGPGV